MLGYPAKDKTGGVWIMALKYKRILLKISGEALGGEKGMGFDEPTMDAICGGVKKAHELGVHRHRGRRRQLLARPLQR